MIYLNILKESKIKIKISDGTHYQTLAKELTQLSINFIPFY